MCLTDRPASSEPNKQTAKADADLPVSTADDYTNTFSSETPSAPPAKGTRAHRSEEHTSELQSRPHISYAVFCLKKKNHHPHPPPHHTGHLTHTQVTVQLD